MSLSFVILKEEDTGNIISLPIANAQEGYYYNGKFYSDSLHTTEMTGLSSLLYVDKTTNSIYRYSDSYIQISGGGGGTSTNVVKFGYYYNGKFYEDAAHTVELEANNTFLYTDVATTKLYRYDTGLNYYAWKNGTTVIYTLSNTPSANDKTYTAVGVENTYTVTSYDSSNDQIEVNSVTYDRDSSDDESTAGYQYYGDSFNYLTAGDIDTLMQSTSQSRWGYLADIIVDTMVSATKIWSSSKVSTELANTLASAKTYADEEIAKFNNASYSLVSSTSEMVDRNKLYLLPISGSDTYSIYALVDDVPTAIGSTSIQLTDYYTKNQTDNLFLTKTAASSTYVGKSEYTTDVGDMVLEGFSATDVTGALNELKRGGVSFENVNIDFNTF